MKLKLNGLNYTRVNGLWECTHFGISCTKLKAFRLKSEARYNEIVEATV